MKNLPEKLKEYGLSISNFSKAIGPFILSQSEKLSEEYAKHKARLTSVEIMKEIVVNEAKMLHAVKEELHKKYIGCDDVERIRIKRDLREVDEAMRVLGIGEKALSYMPTVNEEVNKDTNSKNEISESWIDRFNELAKLNNEPWREDLLARALAKEADSPGGVSPRALWLIGTLEENLFHAFASLLNVSSWIASGFMIPNGGKSVNKITLSDCVLGEKIEIGNLVYMLCDAGLIADTLTTASTIKKGGIVFARYGDEEYVIVCTNADLIVRGIIYTNLGASIASFYEAKANKLGYEIFHNWLDYLNKNNFEITKTNQN